MNFLLSFALLLIVLQLKSIYANLDQVADTEREALVELYKRTNGKDWKRQGNWLVEDPCSNEWYGITCRRDEQERLTIEEM